VKRGDRLVHGDKELTEKLGRNDLCPCGSGRCFQTMLPQQRPLRRSNPQSLLLGKRAGGIRAAQLHGADSARGQFRRTQHPVAGVLLAPVERSQRGHHDETIDELLERDRAAFLPLPAVPYEACDEWTARVSSLSLVRYRRSLRLGDLVLIRP
jgi:hypothetical protein